LVIVLFYPATLNLDAKLSRFRRIIQGMKGKKITRAAKLRAGGGRAGGGNTVSLKTPRRSREAERQVAENFRYVAAILELQGGLPPVRRMKIFRGPLPGIYPTRS
jgi:hypothetical protein